MSSINSEAQTRSRRASRQLRRLDRLMDVVYALVIWRLFTLLPRPEAEQLQWDSVKAMFVAEWLTFVVVLVGLIIVIVYWLQNNLLYSYLKATDSVHSALAILQLFAVLFLLYAIHIGIVGGTADDTRFLESVAATAVGVVAYLGWRYASYDRRLLDSTVAPEDVRTVTRQTLTEPLTALVTIPFAFLSPWAWDLSWFLYPLWRHLLGPRKQ